MQTTYVPNLNAADGKLGTGSNMKTVSNPTGPDPTYVPNSNAADGSDGTTGALATDYISYAGPPLQNPPIFQYLVVDINMRVWTFNPNTQQWQ